MDDDYNVRLTPEEEKMLLAFSGRRRSMEIAEENVLKKYTNRAAVAKQVWGAACAVVVTLVFGTSYIMDLQSGVERNQEELSSLRTEIAGVRTEIAGVRGELSVMREQIVGLRVSLSNKQERP